MKLDEDDLAASALWGAYECLRYGVTSIADASYGGHTVARAARAAGLRARVYLEVFGLDDSRLDETMERLEAGLARAQAAVAVPTPAAGPPAPAAALGTAGEAPPAGPPLEWGVSPHAPYTVSQDLYAQVAQFARSRGLHMTTHVAESSTEVRLSARRPGPAAWAYKSLSALTGGGWRLPAERPLDHVGAAGALGPDQLVVHAVQLDDSDIGLLARSGSPVAHCPRSNRRLGCGAAPVFEMRAAGITVGLGTDSLASNDSLDMLAEMRVALEASSARAALRAPASSAGRLAPLSARDVLTMATLDGARALGWGDLVGSLDAGKRADLAVVRLAPRDQARGPVDGLAEAVMGGEVCMTMVDGRVAWEGEDTPAEVVAAMAAVRARIALGD